MLRLLRGEEIDAVSRKLEIKASTLAQWQTEFLAAGEARLKSLKRYHRDRETDRLKRKVGELTMDLELLQELIPYRYSEPAGIGPAERFRSRKVRWER